jgi:hypothetical protein
MVERPPAFALGLRRSTPKLKNRWNGLGRTPSSSPEAWRDKSAIRRHSKRLRYARAPPTGDRLRARGGCYGARDTPRKSSRDGPVRPQGGTDIRTAGLRVHSAAAAANGASIEHPIIGRCARWQGRQQAGLGYGVRSAAALAGSNGSRPGPSMRVGTKLPRAAS